MIPSYPAIHFPKRDRLRRFSPSQRVLCGAILGVAIFGPCHGSAQEPGTKPAVLPAPNMTEIQNLLSQSNQHLANGNLDLAAREASLAIQLDPHNASAYELRGSIYTQGKLWDRADRDYASADKISPDVSYKYKRAEIKFLQQSYDEAKPLFAKLQGDARLGDLATYKVFLCDLFGGHDATALRKLGAFDATQKNPSYYYGHAAWAWAHNQLADMDKVLSTAKEVYGNSTYDLYTASWTEALRFHPETVTFVTKDGRAFDQTSAILESAGLRVSTQQGWVTLPLEQLPDDLSVFPEDLRDQLARRRASNSTQTTSARLISFTTRSGQSYHQVRWSVSDASLLVLSPDGWIPIPFGQLPVDLSSFPPDLQQIIRQKGPSNSSPSNRIEVVSFTTQSGKRYDQVRASPTANGLRILTEDGWIILPSRELPGDLSAFPPDWRSQLQTKSIPDDDPSAMKLISFTTKKGKHYEQVRAALESGGLRLLTSLGWIAVPFNQLPDDLSAFPAAWRQTITTRQNEHRHNATTFQPESETVSGSN